MKKQQEARVLPNEAAVRMASMQEELPGMADVDKQQHQKLARLRIERNRAARHARCAKVPAA